MREAFDRLNVSGETGVDQPVTADLSEGSADADIDVPLPDGVSAADEDNRMLEVSHEEDKGFGELDESAGASADSMSGIEGVGNVIAATRDRGELTDDFRCQYGHAVVALAEAHTRAVLEEDELSEQWASDLLAQEIAGIREDLDRWEAGLEDPASDAYHEATGILMHFNEVDRAHLPPTMVHVATEETDMDEFLPGRLKTETEDPDEIELGPRLFEWFKGLSDERLINYFQWSEAQTDAVSAELLTWREEIKANVRSDFSYLIEDDLAPESAREALENGFRYTTRFGALSSFESGYYHAAGLFDSEARRIGVMREHEASQAGNYVGKSHRYFFHEDMHALDAANSMGLIYLESEDEVPLTWVDEAVKEHLTLSAIYGQSNIVDPAERSDSGAYTDLRELLHLVLTGGDSDIAISDVTQANFERRGGDGQLRPQLAERLRESYRDKLPDIRPGETILHMIARDINAATKPRQAEVALEWIQKMYAVKGVEQLTDLPTDRAFLTIRTEA